MSLNSLRREYERQRKREADKKRIKPFAKVGLDNIVRVVNGRSFTKTGVVAHV